MTLNVTLHKNFQNFLTFLKFRVSDSPNDREYKKIVFQTLVNWKSALQIALVNPLSHGMVKEAFDRMNFTLKFPLKSGNYQLINYTWPLIDYFRYKTRFRVDITVQGQLNEKNGKKFRLLCDVNCTGKSY